MIVSIYRVIDKLEGYVREGTWLPFGHRILSEERLVEYIEKMRSTLPEEVGRAKVIATNKDRVIRDAQEKAQQIVSRGRQPKGGAGRSNRHHAASAHDGRRRPARSGGEGARIRAGADAYAGQVLADLEMRLATALGSVKKGQEALVPRSAQPVADAAAKSKRVAPSTRSKNRGARRGRSDAVASPANHLRETAAQPLTQRRGSAFVVTVAALVTLAALALVPTPFYLVAPGAAVDLSRRDRRRGARAHATALLSHRRFGAHATAALARCGLAARHADRAPRRADSRRRPVSAITNRDLWVRRWTTASTSPRTSPNARPGLRCRRRRAASWWPTCRPDRRRGTAAHRRPLVRVGAQGAVAPNDVSSAVTRSRPDDRAHRPRA
jgi:hypothetical protein